MRRSEREALQPLQRSRHGRGEEQRLPTCGHLRDDGAQVVGEAELQQPIRLVDDKKARVAHDGRTAARAQMVRQPPGGSDDDVRPLGELESLPHHINATDDERHTNRHASAER